MENDRYKMAFDIPSSAEEVKDFVSSCIKELGYDFSTGRKRINTKRREYEILTFKPTSDKANGKPVRITLGSTNSGSMVRFEDHGRKNEEYDFDISINDIIVILKEKWDCEEISKFLFPIENHAFCCNFEGKENRISSLKFSAYLLSLHEMWNDNYHSLNSSSDDNLKPTCCNYSFPVLNKEIRNEAGVPKKIGDIIIIWRPGNPSEIELHIGEGAKNKKVQEGYKSLLKEIRSEYSNSDIFDAPPNPIHIFPQEEKELRIPDTEMNVRDFISNMNPDYLLNIQETEEIEEETNKIWEKPVPNVKKAKLIIKLSQPDPEEPNITKMTYHAEVREGHKRHEEIWRPIQKRKELTRNFVDKLENKIRMHWNQGLSKIEIKQFIEEAHIWKLIHDDVLEVSKKRFERGEYAYSVFSAFKVVNNRVKKIYKNRTGEEEDGKNLMMKAFRIRDGDPVINISKDLSTSTGTNIQEGYRFLFAGSIMAFRNPNAHEEIEISAERAVHLLFVASALMSKIDERKNGE